MDVLCFDTENSFSSVNICRFCRIENEKRCGWLFCSLLYCWLKVSRGTMWKLSRNEKACIKLGWCSLVYGLILILACISQLLFSEVCGTEAVGSVASLLPKALKISAGLHVKFSCVKLFIGGTPVLWIAVLLHGKLYYASFKSVGGLGILLRPHKRGVKPGVCSDCVRVISSILWELFTSSEQGVWWWWHAPV